MTICPHERTKYTYDNIGQLKTVTGFESDTVTPRLHEQFGYAYDAAWNLNRRTNNALIQNFGVNTLNELTNTTRSGTFTVVGDATEPKGGTSSWGYPPGVTNVVVSGTGLSSCAANLYLDGSWARSGATLANGANTYTAVGKDTYNRTDTDSHTVNTMLKYNGQAIAANRNAVALSEILNLPDAKDYFINQGTGERQSKSDVEKKRAEYISTNEEAKIHSTTADQKQAWWGKRQFNFLTLGFAMILVAKIIQPYDIPYLAIKRWFLGY